MTKQDISILGKENELTFGRASAALGKDETSFDLRSLARTFKLIGEEWMLVTAGTEDKFNTMTASWGGVGILWNKPVAFLFIRPERYTHDFIEENDRLTLSFYGEKYRKALQICGTKSGRDTDKVKECGITPLKLESGAMTFAESRMTLDCRKLFKTEMTEANFIDREILAKQYGAHGGMHTIYVVEIEGVYTK